MSQCLVMHLLKCLQSVHWLHWHFQPSHLCWGLPPRFVWNFGAQCRGLASAPLRKSVLKILLPKMVSAHSATILTWPFSAHLKQTISLGFCWRWPLPRLPGSSPLLPLWYSPGCCPLVNRLENGGPDPRSVLPVAVSVISFLSPLISLENLVTSVGSWFPISHTQFCPVCLPLTSPCPVLELTYKLQTSSSQCSGGFHALLLNSTSTKGCAQFIKSVKVICRDILEFLMQASPEDAVKNFIRVAGDCSSTLGCIKKGFQSASPIRYWFYGSLASAVECSWQVCFCVYFSKDAVHLLQHVSDGSFCPQANYNAACLPIQW